MGKSIRSKQKRKHRTEFRNTIGTVAYNKNMELIQSKLKTCIENQSTSMEGLTRLSKQLGNSELPEPQNFDNHNNNNKMVLDNNDGEGGGVADALETTTAETTSSTSAKDYRGENKAPKRKARRGKKYSYMHHAKGTPKAKDQKEKPKPRFFCQF